MLPLARPVKLLWMDKQLHKELLGLAIPTIISTLAVPLLGLVDTIVLGRLPDVSNLGAAAAAGAIFNAIFFIFSFIRMGTTGLVAQARGQQDQRQAAMVLFQGVFLGAILGVALAALQPIISLFGFQLIGASSRVTILAKSYFAIRMFEMPFTLMTLGITGYLRGQGDATVPMYLVLGATGVNIVGDLLLVPELGIQGAALASLGAQILQWLGACVIAWRRAGRLIEMQWLRSWQQQPWRRFLFIQSDLFLRTLFLVLMMGSATALVARLHVPEELAAQAILLQLWSLVSFAVDGFAFATETTVGTWLGRGETTKARGSAQAAILWASAVGMVFSLIYGWGIGRVARIFTQDAQVQAVVESLVVVVSVSQPINALAYILDGILIGATDTRYLRNAMVLSALVYVIVVTIGWGWYGLSLPLIWWSLVVLMCTRVFTLGLRFLSGSWLVKAKLR